MANNNSLHTFVLFIAAFMIISWIAKSLTRFRSLWQLYKALGRQQVVRINGLEHVGDINREHVQRILLSQSDTTVVKIEKVSVRSHFVKETFLLQKSDKLTCSLSFALDATAHTKIEVYIGVLASAIETLCAQSETKISKNITKKGKQTTGGLRQRKHTTSVAGDGSVHSDDRENGEQSMLQRRSKRWGKEKPVFSKKDYLFKTTACV